LQHTILWRHVLLEYIMSTCASIPSAFDVEKLFIDFRASLLHWSGTNPLRHSKLRVLCPKSTLHFQKKKWNIASSLIALQNRKTVISSSRTGGEIREGKN